MVCVIQRWFLCGSAFMSTRSFVHHQRVRQSKTESEVSDRSFDFLFPFCAKTKQCTLWKDQRVERCKSEMLWMQQIFCTGFIVLFQQNYYVSILSHYVALMLSAYLCPLFLGVTVCHVVRVWYGGAGWLRAWLVCFGMLAHSVIHLMALNGVFSGNEEHDD